MKKLFFAAALAIVAVGGAFATSSNNTIAPPYYDFNGNQIDCVPVATLSCEEIDLYYDTNHQLPIDRSEVEDLEYTPL